MITKLLAAAAALLAGSQSVPKSEAPTIAIVGATVLPMTKSERLRDQTVLVSGDRIIAVGPRSRVRVPSSAKVIDGRGQVLMPGLVDMHVHLAPVPGNPGDAAQRALAVMLAHGVTTARGMAGNPAHLEARARIERGELAGPRYYAAAPMLHEKNTTSAEAGRAAVASAKKAGYDLIKSHQLPDIAIWQAVADESRRLGMPTAGHVPNNVGVSRALAAGQQIEHLDGIAAELIRAGDPGAKTDFGQLPPPAVLQAALKLDDKLFDAVARRLAAGKSWHVPTLSLFEKIGDVSTPTEQLAAGSDMRFVPDGTLKQWADQREGLQQELVAADGTALIEFRRRIVQALHRAGVPLMAGSDTAQAFHIWGPGLHQEIESLTAAGLSRMDALLSATVVPRDYFRSLPNGGSALGWKADFGTVEKGARADLILLPGDPSADLEALRRPNLVIAGGRLFDRATLDAMLARAAADAKAPAKP